MGRNVIFVPPREEDEDEKNEDEKEKTPRSQRLPPPEAPYFEMGREVVGKRLRFDPRKRQQKDRAVAKTRTPPTARTIRPAPSAPTKPPTTREQPVTIVIGGVSLIIPDFGLEQPATSAQKPSPKPSRRPVGARTRGPRPRISPSRFSAKKQRPAASQTT